MSVAVRQSGVNAKKALLGAVVAVAAVSGLMAVSLGNSTTRTVPFTEVATAMERVEVYGVLDKKSIQSIDGAKVVQFDLLEEEGAGDKKRLTGRRLTVLYKNNAVALPANFPAASHARAAGYFDPAEERLVSDTVFTKCPSKYEENNLDASTKEALTTWRKSVGEEGVEPAKAGNQYSLPKTEQPAVQY